MSITNIARAEKIGRLIARQNRRLSSNSSDIFNDSQLNRQHLVSYLSYKNKVGASSWSEEHYSIEEQIGSLKGSIIRFMDNSDIDFHHSYYRILLTQAIVQGNNLFQLHEIKDNEQYTYEVVGLDITQIAPLFNDDAEKEAFLKGFNQHLKAHMPSRKP